MVNNLDLNAIFDTALMRFEKMKGNPEYRGDPDFTFSAWLLKQKESLEQQIRLEAGLRKETILKDSSPGYVRKTMAGKIGEGDFDRNEIVVEIPEGEVPQDDTSEEPPVDEPKPEFAKQPVKLKTATKPKKK